MVVRSGDGAEIAAGERNGSDANAYFLAVEYRARFHCGA